MPKWGPEGVAASDRLSSEALPRERPVQSLTGRHRVTLHVQATSIDGGASWGCFNLVPQTGGLITEKGVPPGLETRHLRFEWGSEAQVGHGGTPSAGSRGGFWGLQAALSWWPRPSRLCLRLHTASPLCLCLFSSLL